jgi:hypothetical protein
LRLAGRQAGRSGGSKIDLVALTGGKTQKVGETKPAALGTRPTGMALVPHLSVQFLESLDQKPHGLGVEIEVDAQRLLHSGHVQGRKMEANRVMIVQRQRLPRIDIERHFIRHARR